jgi:molecular chaperone GrpE
VVSEQEKNNPDQRRADDSDLMSAAASAAAEKAHDLSATAAQSPDAAESAIAGAELDSAASPEQLREQLEQSQVELAEAKEQALRAVADAQNARRRAEKDVTNARRYALEKFVQELLPVIDNLERAMESAQPEELADSTMRQGIELTLKSFFDVLKRFNVEPVEPVAEPFDPQLHEAISMVKNAEVEPNTVLNVVQKGYTLNGRLVRPAMVVVSSA